MTEQDLDKLFKNALENSSIEPPPGVWEAVSASTAVSSVTTASVTIVKWVAASLIAASAVTAVYLSTGSKQTADSTGKKQNPVVNLMTDSNVVSDNVTAENNPETEGNTAEYNPLNLQDEMSEIRDLNDINPVVVDDNVDLLLYDPIVEKPVNVDKPIVAQKTNELPSKKMVQCPKLLNIAATKTDFNTYRFEAQNAESLITWYYGDGASSTGVTGFHLYPDVAKTYTVVAVGLNVSGCSDTGRIQIQAEANKPVLFVPDYFTPNGDGTNDEFYITIENSKSIDYFDLIVFDSKNRPVFRSTNPTDKWDGKCGAIECGVGTYKLVVSYRLSGTSKIITQKNSLLLNR